MLRRWAVLGLCVAVPALAGPPPRKKEVLPPAVVVQSAAEALREVQARFTSLEYDEVIPRADALLARADLTLEQRLEGLRLLGSSKAIVVDPVEAEKPFRLLLRARPDFQMPQDTPPKILAVFRKVETEERALGAQLKEVERARIVAGLKLLGELPDKGIGGRPLLFNFRLRDASGSVESIAVPFRRQGQPVFSSLALQRTEGGDWQGRIPGEFTADPAGFGLEYFVETRGVDGVLLTEGTASAPRLALISAGSVDDARKKPVPRWAFYTSAATAGALGVTAGGVGVALLASQNSYAQKAARGASGAELTAHAQQGQQLATATTALLVSAGITALATGALAFFTDWSTQEP